MVGLVGLSGCVAKPVALREPPMAFCKPAATVTRFDPSSAALSELLTYQNGLRQQGYAELNRALQGLNNQTASPGVMLRRAMLLAAMKGPGDLSRAQLLVDTVAQSAGGGEHGYRPLAQLLGATYADARRQEDTLDKLDKLTVQMREAQRRNDQLSEKLEALKNIERSLSVRPSVPAASAK